MKSGSLSLLLIDVLCKLYISWCFTTICTTMTGCTVISQSHHTECRLNLPTQVGNFQQVTRSSQHPLSIYVLKRLYYINYMLSFTDMPTLLPNIYFTSSNQRNYRYCCSLHSYIIADLCFISHHGNWLVNACSARAHSAISACFHFIFI